MVGLNIVAAFVGCGGIRLHCGHNSMFWMQQKAVLWMGKWEMVRLGDVLEYEQPTKYIVESTDYSNDYSTPVLTAGQSFILGYTNEQNNIFNESLPVIIFDDFTTAIKYVDFPFKVKSSAMKILKAQKDVDIKFMYYYMSRIKVDTELHKRYWVSMYSNIQIPLPPLPIQQKIAHILDRANALMEKRKAQIEKLDLLVKSQFVEIFGDPVTNPMGWEVKRLGEVFKIRSSKRVYQHEQTNEGVPFLRVSDLTSRIINGVDSCSLYISKELFDAYRKSGYVPKVGDILVTSRGTLGLCYIVQDTDEFYFQDGMISWLSQKKVEVSSDYILYLFCTGGIKRQIERASAGSTVGYLSLGNLENLNIMFPPYTLQTQFAAFVERMEAQKAQLKKSLALLELNYKSLMQKCFSGEMF